jgi:hypothetical protein
MPLFTAFAIAGTLAAQARPPSQSWVAKHAIGVAKRTCAELNRQRTNQERGRPESEPEPE